MPAREDLGSHLLVAGFGAFPGAPANPSEEVASRIGTLAEGAGVQASGLVLPVEWDRAWPALEQAIRERRPAAVLLVGLHARSERFRLERRAFNEREPGRPDAAGREAATPRSVEGGPPMLASRMPTAEIAACLHDAGIDFEFSDDAGRYLCNDTLYWLAFNAEALGVRRYGFLHTPLTRDLAGEGAVPPAGGRLVSAADLDRTVTAILACLAGD